MSNLKVKKLPTGYTQLDYIQSSGTQYIDTGVIPSDITNVELNINFPTLPTSSVVPIGCRTGSGSGSYIVFVVSNGRARFDLGTETGTYISGFTANTDYKIKIENKGFYINDELKYTQTGTLESNNLPMYLLGGNHNGSILYRTSAKLSGCKIWQDGTTLSRNFIPAKRNSDNEIGLYDLANNVFYTNQGTGTFTAGTERPYIDPEISVVRLPTAYQEVEYLQSSGTQYIDTGLKGDQNTRAVLKLSVPTGTTGMMFGSRTGATSNAFAIWAAASTVPSQIRIGWANTSGYAGSNWVADKTYNFDISKDGFYIDGILVYSPTEATFETPNNLKLFAYDTNGTITTSAGNYYGEQCIYTNDTLSRKLVPCYRRSDNVAGMYDLTNSGKNLLPFDSDAYTVKQSSSHTVTQLSNGISVYGAWYVGYIFTLKPNTTYTLKSNMSYDVNRGIIIRKGTSTGGAQVAALYTSGNASTFTTDTETQYTMYFYSGNGTAGTATYTNLQLEESSTATTFEHPAFYTNMGTGTFTVGSSSTYYTPSLWVYAKRLPNTYQEVEYLQSTGTQYIETNYIPTSDNINIEYKAKTTSYDNLPLGINNINLSNALNINEYNSSLYVRYRGASSTFTTPTSTMEEHIFKLQDNEVFYNGTSLGTITPTASLSVNTSKLSVFTRTSIAETYRYRGYIWYMKVCEGTTKVLDLVPCYRKSDSVAGMYDLACSNVFDKGTDGTSVAVSLANTYGDNKIFWSSGSTSVVVPIQANTTYTIKCIGTASGTIFRAATTTRELTSSDGASNPFTPTSIVRNDSGVFDAITLTSGDSDNYLYIQFSSSGFDTDADILMVVEGTTEPTEYSTPFYINAGTGTFTVGNDIADYKCIYAKYNITNKLTNVTSSSSNPSYILYGDGETYTLTYTAASGCSLPSTVTVAGASYTWDATTGSLVLSNVTGDVYITIVGTSSYDYSITCTTLDHCTASSSNPVGMNSGETATLTFTADSGYEFDSGSAVVSNADSNFDETTGILTLSNPSGNIEIDVYANEQ